MACCAPSPAWGRGELVHPGWFYAREAGGPGARATAEALGPALGANPLPVVVPCHRVVRADGRAGGYVGGARRKRLLLQREQQAGRRAAPSRPADRGARAAASATSAPAT